MNRTAHVNGNGNGNGTHMLPAALPSALDFLSMTPPPPATPSGADMAEKLGPLVTKFMEFVRAETRGAEHQDVLIAECTLWFASALVYECDQLQLPWELRAHVRYPRSVLDNAEGACIGWQLAQKGKKARRRK